MSYSIIFRRIPILLFFIGAFFSHRFLASDRCRIAVLNSSNSLIQAHLSRDQEAIPHTFKEKKLTNIAYHSSGSSLVIEDVRDALQLGPEHHDCRLILGYDDLLRKAHYRRPDTKTFIIVNRSAVSLHCSWEGEGGELPLESHKPRRLLFEDPASSCKLCIKDAAGAVVCQVGGEDLQRCIKGRNGMLSFYDVGQNNPGGQNFRITYIIDNDETASDNVFLANTTDRSLYCTLANKVQDNSNTYRCVSRTPNVTVQKQGWVWLHSKDDGQHDDNHTNALWLLVSDTPLKIDKGIITYTPRKCQVGCVFYELAERVSVKDARLLRHCWNGNEQLYSLTLVQCERGATLSIGQRIALGFIRDLCDFNIIKTIQEAAKGLAVEVHKTDEEVAQDLLLSPRVASDTIATAAEVYTESKKLQRELDFVKAREEKAKQTILQSLRKMDLESKDLSDRGLEEDDIRKYCPRIGFAFSGGGYRAMMETLGYLKGASNLQLLDCASYMCGLSGSTWALFPWVHSRLSISDFIERQRVRTHQGSLRKLLADLNAQYREQLVKDGLHGHATSFFDIYGHAICQALIGGNAHDIKLSQLEPRADTHPLPIGVAVQRVLPGGPYSKALGVNERHRWFEFSPFYVGATEHSQWVDSGTFDSAYYGAERKIGRPPRTLGSYLGTAGSAFAFSWDNIANQSLLGVPLQPIVRTSQGIGTGFKTLFNLVRNRFVSNPQQVEHNLFKLDETRYNNPFIVVDGQSTEAYVPLKDGGHHIPCEEKITYPEEYYMAMDSDDGHVANTPQQRFKKLYHNLATPPLLGHRQVDVMIVCDAPESPEVTFDQLRASISFAQQRSDNKVHESYPACTLPAITVDDVQRFEEEETWRKKPCLVLPGSDCEKNEALNLKTPHVVYIQGHKYEPNSSRSGSYHPETLGSRLEAKNFEYSDAEFDNLADFTCRKIIDCKPHIKDAILDAVAAKKKAAHDLSQQRRV